ncbi:MAG: hypothetical protein AAFY78_00635 [Cyanobacteria bacterium J06648_16]
MMLAEGHLREDAIRPESKDDAPAGLSHRRAGRHSCLVAQRWLVQPM